MKIQASVVYFLTFAWFANATGPNKVPVCHKIGGDSDVGSFTGIYKTIEVSANGNAVDAHLAQGGAEGLCEDVCADLCGTTNDCYVRHITTSDGTCYCPASPLYLCGQNTFCDAGECACIDGYEGEPSDPNAGCSSACRDSSLVLLTDDFGEETAWELRVNGVVELSVPFETYDDNTEYTEDLGCLSPTDCYQFTIFDSTEDGITPTGDWSVQFGESVFPSPSGGNFAFQETISFGSCGGRRLMEAIAVPKLNAFTTKIAEDDDATVEISVLVDYDQNHVLIEVDGNDLFDGIVTADSPKVVSFSVGNIYTSDHVVTITGEEGTIELLLKRRQ